MNRFFVCVLACLACVYSQPSFAAVTSFAESVREMQAILDATAEFPSLFVAGEFIVDLKRLTPELNTVGRVKYLLQTCTISNKNKCKKVNNYVVKLLVEPNPAIGPYVITVENFKKVRKIR